MKLQTRAMLAGLHISRWAGTRTDKKVSSEVAATHAVAERRAGHYRKHAINVDATSFKAVVTAAGDLRTKHVFYTLPWGEDGQRILPAANFDKYSADMRGLTAAFENAVSTFVAEFTKLKDAARVELNGLYDETDYPKNIAAHFAVRLKILPLPDSEDFRVKLPDGAVDTIRSEIESEVKRATSEAMREPYERLKTHIDRMVERLSDPKKVFRDTLITGLADLCNVLPGLNLTNDPALDNLRKRAEALIAGVEPESLRLSETLRATVAKRAEEIQNVMSAFMGSDEP